MRHRYGHRGLGPAFWILFGLLWLPGVRSYISDLFQTISYAFSDLFRNF